MSKLIGSIDTQVRKNNLDTFFIYIQSCVYVTCIMMFTIILQNTEVIEFIGALAFSGKRTNVEIRSMYK